jgi:hypothetical protein
LLEQIEAMILIQQPSAPLLMFEVQFYAKSAKSLDSHLRAVAQLQAVVLQPGVTMVRIGELLLPLVLP